MRPMNSRPFVEGELRYIYLSSGTLLVSREAGGQGRERGGVVAWKRDVGSAIIAVSMRPAGEIVRRVADG